MSDQLSLVDRVEAALIDALTKHGLILVDRELLTQLARTWIFRTVPVGHHCPEVEDGHAGQHIVTCRHCHASPAAGHATWCPAVAAEQLLTAAPGVERPVETVQVAGDVL